VGGVAAPAAGGLVMLGCCAVTLGACGASGVSAAAVDHTCQNLTAVLSDGPDPTADPIGYAEAQILPLRQVHTNDHDLELAIGQLDRAYQQLFQTDAADRADKAVSEASARLDAICPGAAP